jgi:4-azaleucine resistance transporter AzlC
MYRTMRSILRTSDPIVRSVAALCMAGFVVGLSFGAIAAAAHIPLVKIVAMSVFIYAGGAQFLAVGIVSAGGGAVAIILAGLLLNARHLPFGLAIGDVIGARPVTRVAGSHLMTDESVAFALAQSSLEARRRAYWITGIGLFCTWNVACVIGVLAGSAIGDPATFGVDAGFPAGLWALVLPTLREKPALRVAVAAAVVALVATPFLPAGLPVLVALVGLVFAIPLPVRERVTTS